MLFVGGVVEERLGEACRTLLRAALVDDDELAHEVQEAPSVRVRVRGRDLRAVAQVDPDL